MQTELQMLENVEKINKVCCVLVEGVHQDNKYHCLSSNSSQDQPDASKTTAEQVIIF